MQIEDLDHAEEAKALVKGAVMDIRSTLVDLESYLKYVHGVVLDDDGKELPVSSSEDDEHLN